MDISVKDISRPGAPSCPGLDHLALEIAPCRWRSIAQGGDPNGSRRNPSSSKQRDRAVREYRLALQTKDDTEGAQALAAKLLSGGDIGADVSLHNVVTRYVVPAVFVNGPKPILKIPRNIRKKLGSPNLKAP
jgi:hypothetical protein